MAETAYTTFSISPLSNTPHALRLTFSNPPINLITPLFLSEIVQYLTSLSPTTHPDPPKLLILSSSNPDFWLSHLDLHIISAKYPLAEGQNAGEALHNLGVALQLLRDLPTIFVSEINGRAIGGGNEFAMNTDLRFAGPNAKFGIPEVAGGVVHGGALQRLVQVIGPSQTLEWNLSARTVDAKEAERIGWVNRAFESGEELRSYVDGLAMRVAQFPRGGIEGTKKSVQEALLGQGSVEKDMQRLGELAHTEEAQEAIAKFIEAGDQGRSQFELGLPETAGDIWKAGG
ncbi:ClpP/crotonase-like domain-containing protein [Lophiotrema nucula]|uniref:ClpP/crotonase-like domain-containing protein n=1 Tax=Lophiotrema nucula TaxID=690887 RepID=A0A6A5YIL0_9PLEO|nr:ClpP/crotonase-like domain-containing protein [Lophiotrema nucula]